MERGNTNTPSEKKEGGETKLDTDSEDRDPTPRRRGRGTPDNRERSLGFEDGHQRIHGNPS